MSGEARRELTAAVIGSVVAGGLAILAGGQTWAQLTYERSGPLPPLSEAMTGTDAAPLVPAAGLVLLAGAVALYAVRGAGRVAVGLLLVVAGGALAWSGGRVLTVGLDERAAVMAATVRPAVVEVETFPAWPAVAVVAGVLGVAVGVLVVVRGRGWPAMGRRYERTPAVAAAPARRSDEDRAQDAWKALDRGEDPTSPAEDRP